MNEHLNKIRVAITTKDLVDIMCRLTVLQLSNESKDKEIADLRAKIADLTTTKEKGEE